MVCFIGCLQELIKACRYMQTEHRFAAIESDLEVIQKQLARLPTRRELARAALGIIFAR
jgi:hypothetical protein